MFLKYAYYIHKMYYLGGKLHQNVSQLRFEVSLVNQNAIFEKTYF